MALSVWPYLLLVGLFFLLVVFGMSVRAQEEADN
jgi:hypothetical protein